MINDDLLRDAVRGWSDDALREWLIGGLRRICSEPEAAATDALAPLVLTAAEPWSAQIDTAVRALDARDGERVRTALGRALLQTASTTDPVALPTELWRLAVLLQPPGDLVSAARHVLARFRHLLGDGLEGRTLIDAVFAAVRTRPFDGAVAGFFQERRHALGWRPIHARAYVLHAARHEPSNWRLFVTDFADALKAGLESGAAQRGLALRLLEIVPLPLVVAQLAAIRTQVPWLHDAMTVGDDPLIRNELRSGGMFAVTASAAVRYAIGTNDNAPAWRYGVQDELDDDANVVSDNVLAMLTAKVASPERTSRRASEAVGQLARFTTRH